MDADAGPDEALPLLPLPPLEAASTPPSAADWLPGPCVGGLPVLPSSPQAPRQQNKLHSCRALLDLIAISCSQSSPRPAATRFDTDASTDEQVEKNIAVTQARGILGYEASDISEALALAEACLGDTARAAVRIAALDGDGERE